MKPQQLKVTAGTASGEQLAVVILQTATKRNIYLFQPSQHCSTWVQMLEN